MLEIQPDWTETLATRSGTLNDLKPLLVENPIFAPYRKRVFEGLSQLDGYQTTFAYGDSHPASALRSVLQPEGLNVSLIKNRFVGSSPLLTYQQGLVELVRSRPWNAMIATYDPRIVTNLLAMRAAQRQGTKFIFWGHGIRPRGRFSGIYRNLAMRADALVLYSGMGQKGLEEIGVPSEKLFVAWNAIETEELRVLSSNDWSNRDRILYVGRLVEDKRVDLLIRSFALALDRLPNHIKLTIIGTGPEEQALKALAESLRLGDRINFLGEVYDQTKLATQFNRALMSVSPGYVGLSAVHALGFGVPMLFADREPHSPEIEALVIGENSESFAAKDAGALADSMVSLTHNPELLAKYGSQGQALVCRQFSIETMLQGFSQALKYVNQG